MGVSKANSGSFSSDHQPKRKRGKSRRTQMLEVLRKRGLPENELWDEVLTLGLNGDGAALNSFLNRLSSPEKATLPKLSIELDDSFFSLSRSGKMDFLVWLSLRGSISADVASTIAGMISGTAGVAASEVIAMRLEALRELQGDENDNPFPASEEYALLRQLADDSKREVELLAELSRNSGTDLEPHIGDEQGSTDNDSTSDNGEDMSSE